MTIQQMFEPILKKIMEQKKYLFFAIPFFFVIIAIIASLFIMQPKTEDTQIQPTSTPSPTRENTEDPLIEDITISPNEAGQTITDPTTKILLEQQAIAEEQFAAEQAAIQTEYPWISNLPLQEENYFFYFDVETKRFIGKLYPQTLAGTPVETQAEEMKAAIRSQAASRGIPLTSYRIDWIVTPE